MGWSWVTPPMGVQECKGPRDGVGLAVTDESRWFRTELSVPVQWHVEMRRRSASMPQSQRGPLYSVDQAAEYLGIRPGTLRNWLSARRITYVKVGRLTRVPLASLERFVADNTVEAVEELEL